MIVDPNWIATVVYNGIDLCNTIFNVVVNGVREMVRQRPVESVSLRVNAGIYGKRIYLRKKSVEEI